MPGKRVRFDDATWAAVDLLAREHSQSFQELAEEAFEDLLAKYDRSVDLKTQLVNSVKKEEADGGVQADERRIAGRRKTGRSRAARK